MHEEGNKEINEYYQTPPGFKYENAEEENGLGNGESVFNEEEIETEFILADPETVGFYYNIRAYNPEHVHELARSINSTGQRQPVIGDMVEIDGHTYIRILAGQHRTLAMREVNKWRRENDIEPLLLQINLYKRTLNPHEILQIQMSENLQNPMTPAEEAESIHLLWKEFINVFGEEASIRSLARGIGRSYGKVYTALKFMEIHPEVIELVKAGNFLYSLGVAISRIEDSEKQLEVAMRIIMHNLDREDAEKAIQGAINENLHIGLFSDEEITIMKRNDHRIAFTTAADKAAQDAAGYFQRILYLIDRMNHPEKATTTETIADILADFIFAANEFLNLLEKMNMNIANKIREKS